MTPTNEIRAKLDELGIEHYDHENGEPLRDLSEAGTDPATSWCMGGANVCAVPNKQGTFDLWIDHCTPEQAIAATVGARDYTYDEWRAINEAVGDAMEYAHEHAVMYPDKADPLWNIDEYVNRVLEVAYGPKDATTGAGTCRNIAELNREGVSGYFFVCSECGLAVHADRDINKTNYTCRKPDGSIDLRTFNSGGEYKFERCPRCGRKVTE